MIEYRKGEIRMECDFEPWSTDPLVGEDFTFTVNQIIFGDDFDIKYTGLIECDGIPEFCTMYTNIRVVDIGSPVDFKFKEDITEFKEDITEVFDMFDREKELDIRDALYETLSQVLDRAYSQASEGKGNERHATDKPFDDQPMQSIQDLVGEGFALGQAIKKIQESTRMPTERAVTELLGAINYIAGAIIHLENK